jgi:glutathionyl-hydroquinone reductase
VSTATKDRAGWDREIAEGGRFQRQTSAFRRWVTADGSSGFPAEPGRYHLYVSLACPWAHRSVIVRRLKGLEDVVSLSVVDPYRDEQGWAFRAENGGEPDPVNGFRLLSEAYLATDPNFDGRVTVPVLWDRETRQIVNNESSEVIRMLAAFDRFADHPVDLYPEDLRGDIDAVNELVYENINNGVYKAGFARSQQAYEEAYEALFAALDEVDARLAGRRYLAGDRLTEADVRLFTTLVRFDAVYVLHFKCNRNRIVDFDHLWPYLRDLFQTPGFGETVDLGQIKRHYFTTHPGINPTRIIPRGPDLDFTQPHGRG